MNDFEEIKDLRPTSREIIVTLEELYTNKQGKRINLIQPKQVKAVIIENDLFTDKKIDVKEKAKKATVDCLNMIMNSILNNEIDL